MPLEHGLRLAGNGIRVVEWGSTVKGQSRSIQPTARPLHLAELLDFRPDQGIIRLHEQRVVILSAAAMGLLRKELVDTLGLETARRLLLRFGFADGYHDAVSLRDRSNWASPEEGLRAGAMLHTLEGIVHADVIRIEHDESTGRFEEEVSWRDSYEAEQHVHHYGRSPSPVCWSLIGYSSGYVSACMGKEIYFRETECLGQGAKACTVIGRDGESWGAELRSMREDFQAASLGQEVERLRQAVGRRVKELDRRERSKNSHRLTSVPGRFPPGISDVVERVRKGTRFIDRTTHPLDALESADAHRGVLVQPLLDVLGHRGPRRLS